MTLAERLTARAFFLATRAEAGKDDLDPATVELLREASVALSEAEAKLEECGAIQAAYAIHHCESEGCAHEGAYTKRAAEWADKWHQMKADVARYRYLRDDYRSYWNDPATHPYVVLGGAGDTTPIRGAELDAVIDNVLAGRLEPTETTK